MRFRVGTGAWGDWEAIAGADADTSSHTVGGLRNGTVYGFQVRARNPAGDGPASNPAPATPNAGLPARPTGFSGALSMTGPSGKIPNIALSWDDPGDSRITHWDYRTKTGAQLFGAWQRVVIDGDPGAHVPLYLRNVTRGVWTSVEVRAVNNVGPGEPGAVRVAGPPAQPGLKLETLGCDDDGECRVRLAWTYDKDKNAPITHWEMRRQTGNTWGQWRRIPGSDGTTRSHVETSDTDPLFAGQNYKFQVRGALGTYPGNESHFRLIDPDAPGLPGAPRSVRAVGGDGRIALEWRAPLNVPAVGAGAILRWQLAIEEAGAAGDPPWTTIPGSGAQTASHVVDSLANGVLYELRLRAINDRGAGAAALAVRARPLALPAAPKNLTARAGDRAAILGWTAPDDPDGLIAGYQFRWRATGPSDETGAADWTDVPGGAAARSHWVRRLVNGWAFAFEVRAVNANGQGTPSDAAQATPLAAPASPDDLRTEPFDRGVTLFWEPAADATITGYELRYRAGAAAFGSWTALAGTDASTVRTVLRDLDNGVPHVFELRAVNAAGAGYAASATAVPRAVPAPPAGLSATSLDRAIELSWAPAADDDILRWELRYEAIGGGIGDFAAIPGSGPQTSSHRVSGLQQRVRYNFGLRAVSAAGNGPVRFVRGTAGAVPAAPANLAAVPGNRSVVLSWDDPGDASILRWEERRRLAAGRWTTWTRIPGSAAATVSHRVGGLGSGEIWRFEVRAVNPAGAGAASPTVSAVTLAVPGAPLGLRAAVGDASVTLRWSDPEDSAILRWEVRYGESGGGAAGAWSGIAGGDLDTGTAGMIATTLSGLVNGTEYGFALRAVSAEGAGAAAEIDATPLGLPPRPTGLYGRLLPAGSRHVENPFTDQPVQVGPTAWYLDWDEAPEWAVDEWQFRRTDGSGAWGAWTRAERADGKPFLPRNTAFLVVAAEAHGRPAVFQVRGSNERGVGPLSAPLSLPGVALGPTVTATAVDCSIVETDACRIDLAWEPAAGNTEKIAKWEAELLAGAGTTPAKEGEVSSGDPLAWSWDAPQPNRIYRARVRGWSGADGEVPGAWSEEVRVSAKALPIPARPRSFAAIALDGAVLLRWRVVGEGRVTGWQFQMRAQGGGQEGTWTDIENSGQHTTEHRVGGLKNGTTYRFRLRAVSDGVFGQPSDELRATPAGGLGLPPKPQGLEVGAGRDEADLTWDAADDSTITHWEVRWGRRASAQSTLDENTPWARIAGSGPDTAGHTVTGLLGAVHFNRMTDRLRYGFQIRAVNPRGAGPGSDPAFAVMQFRPLPPTSVSAIPGNGFAILRWSPAAGGENVTGWQVRQRLASARGYAADAWTDIPGSTRATALHLVTGLTNNTRYVFQVRAVTGRFDGLPSAEATVTPVVGPPAPTGVAATPFDAAVELAWDNPGGSGIVGYQYRVRQAGDSWGLAWSNVPNSGASTVGHRVEGLTNDIEHEFQVRASRLVTGFGASYGEPSAIARATPIAVPAKPDGLTATVANLLVELSWNDLGDDSVTGWEIRRRLLGAAAWGAWSAIPGSDADTTSHRLNDIPANQTSELQIRAVNPSGDGAESDPVEAAPLIAPAAPTGVTATALGREVVLAWPATSDETITHWEVRWNAAGGAFGAWAKVFLVEGRTDLSWSATGLRNGVSHRFEIRAVNPSGASAAAAVTATPIAVPLRPQGLTATAGDGSVDLAWSSARDSTIISWEYRTGTAGDAGVAWDQAGWQAMANSDRTTVAHTIGSLNNGDTLAFAIRAVNKVGAGGASETVTATPRAPLATVDLDIDEDNISVRTMSSLTLSVQHLDVQEDEVWELRWKPEGQAGFGAWQQKELTLVSSTYFHKIEGLQGGTTYDIESRVVNPACRDDTLACPVNKFQGTTVTGTPALAAVPGDREARLSWDGWSEDDFTLRHWELRYRAAVEAEYGEWQRAGRRREPARPHGDRPPQRCGIPLPASRVRRQSGQQRLLDRPFGGGAGDAGLHRAGADGG